MALFIRTALLPRQIILHFLSPSPPPPICLTNTLTLIRHAHSHPRALRLPREVQAELENSGPYSKKTDDVEQEESEEQKGKRRSRNVMKREAKQALRLGMELASFSSAQIQRILKAASLEKEVYEALMTVKKLGPDVREGKRRQFNYIGKLLRDAQPDLLAALIQATKDGDTSRIQALAGSAKPVDEDLEEEFYESEAEQEPEDCEDHIALANKWFEGLVEKEVQISNEVYSIDSVEFDRQELRRLVRKVHQAQESSVDEDSGKSANVTAAKKSLNRFLCSLAKRFSSTQVAVL